MSRSVSNVVEDGLDHSVLSVLRINALFRVPAAPIRRAGEEDGGSRVFQLHGESIDGSLLRFLTITIFPLLSEILCFYELN